MAPTPQSAPRPLDEHWRDVVARLDAVEDPTVEELTHLAEARWWLGDVADALHLEERLHERLLADGCPAEAALRGLRIALIWGTRGDLALTQAWLGRASRILEDLPPCVVHGYADYLAATFALEMGGEDPRGAAEAAERLRALSGRFPDRTLECFALTLRGMAAVRAGDLRGFTALDEAMIPVIGGRVDPLWGGDIFCTVIHLCEAVGDIGRMRAWTKALASWATPLSTTFLFIGVTRIHQLQLLRTAGEWDVVERELGDQSAALADKHGWLAGAGFYELGEVHRLRGRDAESRAAYDRARACGIDPQPGEALLLHASGRPGPALDALLVALAGADELERSRLIPTAVDLAVVLGDAALAARLADELEATARRFGTPGLLASAARTRAACLTTAGRWDEAETSLEQAAHLHRQQGQRLEVAEVHEALARVHRGRGDGSRAAAAEATARAIYVTLGATAAIARLDGRESRSAQEAPGGLTTREVVVLVKVASGLSNKEVARELVISDKTVGRHLSNIFAKTGVTSRTGAAAWAREHGLV